MTAMVQLIQHSS